MLVLALFVAALVVALVEEFRTQGQSLVGWACVLLAVGLLVGHF